MLGREGLGALPEPTYRLYNCERGGAQVHIWRRFSDGFSDVGVFATEIQAPQPARG